jgi:hypothetical protein
LPLMSRSLFVTGPQTTSSKICVNPLSPSIGTRRCHVEVKTSPVFGARENLTCNTSLGLAVFILSAISRQIKEQENNKDDKVSATEKGSILVDDTSLRSVRCVKCNHVPLVKLKLCEFKRRALADGSKLAS